jgi:hypothetical protein
MAGYDGLLAMLSSVVSSPHGHAVHDDIGTT